MSDNTTLNLGTGGDVIATDDIGGVKHQLVKLEFGLVDTATLVSASNPLPVVQTGTNNVVNAGTFAVQAAQSGTWSTRTQDGSGNAITSATRGAERAMTVQIVDGSGTQVTSFSGSGTANLLSTANSSATNLGSGAAFTGTSEDTTAYTAIQVSVFSSHASAVDGLSLQQSSNGTNWDITDSFTVSATTPIVIQIPTQARFYRLVYTNGATLTTSLRIQTIFKVSAPRGSAQRPADATSNENDFEQNLAFGMAYNGTTWDRVRGTTANGLAVDITRNIPGTGATNLGKAEDAAHTTGDTGVMMLAVRNDAGTVLAGTTLDYIPITTDSTGAVRVTGSGGTSATDNATFTRGTTTVTPIAGVVETSAPTLTNGNTGAMSLTTGGAVRVDVSSGGISGIVNDAAMTIGTTQGVPVMGRASAAAPTNVSADNDAVHTWHLLSGALVNQPSYAGVLATTGNGASGTGVPRVTLASDSTGNIATIGTSVTPGVAAANLGKAEDAAHTTGDTGIAVWAVRTDTLAASSGTTGDYEAFHTDSLGAVWTRDSAQLVDDAAFTPATSRVMPVGFQADETATDSVDEGDAGCPRMTLDRKVIVSSQAHTAGGATPVSTVSAASTNATSLKASAGQVFSVTVTSINAAVRYLKFYNKASAPTVGTDTPVYVFPIPGNTAGAGCTHNFPQGLEFTTGIAWALTTGATVADTGAVAASEHIVSIGYK